MKSKTKLVVATVLASLALAGIVCTLAWWRPNTAKAEISASLPPPYLNHAEVVDAPYDNPPPPTIAGVIAPGEYAGAGKVTFEGYGSYYNKVEVFFTQDSAILYIAFELPDKTNPIPYASIFIDTNNDDAVLPQSDDFEFRVARDGTAWEYQGDGSMWQQNTPITWTYGLTETMSGWSVEFGIPFAKLGIVPGTLKELGLALGNWNAGPAYFWPTTAISNQPSTWGSLVSSSDWGTLYWKPGPWEDYAPSGMPDFDQKQAPWGLSGPSGIISTHCGPVAMANSLWWFDSKFETLTGTMPPAISDTYRLVTSYNPGVWDDHDPQNVGGSGPPGLVDDLARYFGTNNGLVGTSVISMFYGTHQYLRDHGLWDDYIVTLVEQPDFKWVAEEVMRSEDVILLLGFYQLGPTGTWNRLGGHYVNVAGVDLNGPMIALSDPYVDNAEAGLGPGRILDGALIPHAPIPSHPSFVHDDAGNISHDMYPVIIPSTSPGGSWRLDLYPWTLFESWFYPATEINPHPTIPPGEYISDPSLLMQVEVEFALTVSPYTWKSSGIWEPDPTDPVYGVWRPWEDYAVNGVPDFDQKQDNWIHPLSLTWSYCGPAAAANSLWWFDSKYEPIPLGPPQPPPPPPPAPVLPPPPTPPAAPLPPDIIPRNDGYPLVQTYWPIGSYDDHDPSNVESGLPATTPSLLPWPPNPTAPNGEFVDELAAYFDTDGQMTGYVHVGTDIADLAHGIDLYITQRQDPRLPAGITLRQGYVITMTHSPDFWWVAEEVEHSEDVILLLGFWQYQGSDWVRLGGHYVTAAGVDKQGGFIGLSDPWYDGVEYAWPYAYPSGTPLVIGRAADGWMYLHSPYHMHAAHVHNDAGNISHDVYRALPTDSPGGVWGPWMYMETWEGNFEGQNGGQTGTWDGDFANPVQTEVDGAVAVSPVADLWVSKSVSTDTLTLGDTVTFTIQFGNYGSLPAEDVVLTDTLPTGLVTPTWQYWTSNGLTVTQQTGMTFTWDLPDLAWLDWGIITVTAQVDSDISTWTAEETILTNDVNISTSSIEQYQLPPLDNSASVTITIYRPTVYLPLILRNY
jgi:uncharacterized repeat protein (TIGR01451 family)